MTCRPPRTRLRARGLERRVEERVHAAPPRDLPNAAERARRPTDPRQGAEAEVHRAREARRVHLRRQQRLRRLLQHGRARVGRRDHEDERPREEALAPARAPVERKVAGDLALEETRSLRPEVDLDERLELVLGRLVEQVPVRHDRSRSEALSRLPIAVPVDELVVAMGASRAVEGERDLHRGEAVTLGYPGAGGGTVTYGYSVGGRLLTVSDWASRVSTYTYTPAGLAASIALPNGMATTYTYDRPQRLTLLENKVGATTITRHSYTLDNEGNRTALAEFVSGITAPGGTDSFTMTYDGLHRLTSVSGPVAESFTLDAASNIASRTGPPATNTFDQANRHTSDGAQVFTWSNADRLTQRGSDTFSYDALDRLTSSTVSGTARTYGYDGDGLLASRTQDSTTSYLWDPSGLPQRVLQAGSDRLTYGLGPLYLIRGDGTTLTYARDAQKSVRAELTSVGGVAGSFRYRAYGDIAASTGSGPTLFGYTGQIRDDSGLYYLRARWYDPVRGRFVSRDPLRGEASVPTTLNAFYYGGANPLLLSDPTGLAAILEDDTEPLAKDDDELQRLGGGPGGAGGGGGKNIFERFFNLLNRQTRTSTLRPVGPVKEVTGQLINEVKTSIATQDGRWRQLAHLEEAGISRTRLLRGGTSIERVYENVVTGERVTNHVIVRDGVRLYDTWRPEVKWKWGE